MRLYRGLKEPYDPTRRARSHVGRRLHGLPLHCADIRRSQEGRRARRRDPSGLTTARRLMFWGRTRARSRSLAPSNHARPR